ncbi:MAG: hypothetical protein ABIR24_07030 [Verrucomicrobiota bacterium]
MSFSVGAEAIRPDLDYFPSRFHAAIFRNWDIVPHERLAKVLGVDASIIEKAGKELGLPKTKSLTPEEIHRNIEIVLRRNWPLFPRHQIEGLLNFSPAEFDDFLSKEIFLRALLANPPPGLTPLKSEEPTAQTKVRMKWFGEKVRKHFKNVSDTPEEPRLAFVAELCQAHNPADFIRGTKPNPGDADLRSFKAIHFSFESGIVLKNAIQDFSKYCEQIQHTKKLKLSDTANSSHKTIWLDLTTSSNSVETYTLKISSDSISLSSGSELGLARGLVELERRMAERGGPFLSPTNETNSPSFNPRYVSSCFSLLTDPLGHDLDYGFPDGYLNEIFHQDADGIWLYVLLNDLVPSPVFEGMGAGSEARLQRLRELVNRAVKRGLKVYLYLNEPRAQFLPFFEKYPEVKGQPEGNTAALCTSTELVQKHLRGSCEKLFREVPGLGGVFVITASENLSNCYSHRYGKNLLCPRCSKRTPADVITETIRSMSEGVWSADPKAKFIVWDWSWHSVLGEEVPEQIIQGLPKGVGLMADFERGTRIERGGIPMNVEEYSISTIGPSPRAKIRSAQAKHFGMDFLAKIQLSTTWECGTVPFIPVPNLLARKAQGMRNIGVNGAMATWTIGSYPSPNTEAFAIQNWNPNLSEQEVLRRIAAKRYGPEAVESAVRGWTKLSEAFTEEFPFSVSPYSAPLQHGPSLPLYRRDIPLPYGHVTLFNCKDDWTRWPPPYSPELMTKLLRHMCDRWDDGLKDLQEAVSKSGSRHKMAERDLGVAWMVGYYWRAYANDMEFYKARDAGDIAGMKRIAAEELKATEQAFRLVRADSRFGWELELQYFYRPLDVLERLISLDAVLEPQ